MTVVEKLGRLEITFNTADGKTRRESVTGIVPGAAEQDVYDCATAITGLISDTVANISLLSHKDYAA